VARDTLFHPAQCGTLRLLSSEREDSARCCAASIKDCAMLARSLALFLLAFVVAPASGFAEDAAKDAAVCTSIVEDSLRLACYDRALRPAPSAARTDNKMFAHEPETQKAAADAARVSLLDSRWELEPDSKRGAFHIRAYRPVYLLPAFWTSDVNRTPHSPAAQHDVPEPLDLDSIEAKYQLSLKTKVWENIFGDNGDLWMGYTQVSHWQVYNEAESRPFRETTYEPDATLMFRTDYDVLGFDGRLFGVGLDHQSNGRSNPFSRSWNRVIFDIGLDRDDWALMLRPWWRIPESRDVDDNPDIDDYMGRGDVQLTHLWNGHEFSLLARHSLRGGDRSHGALEFDWAFPIVDELRGHLQVFDGYGESLIDYNHRAWYLGLGVSLLEWY
jgi:phospholipase A1